MTERFKSRVRGWAWEPLLAGRLNDGQRKLVGWSLFLVGAVSTIPLAIQVLGKREALPGEDACGTSSVTQMV